MANILKRQNKDGETLYYIRVYRGRDKNGKVLKPFITTFKPSPTWSEETVEKKLQAFAAEFEYKCKKGVVATSNVTFEQYAENVLEHKLAAGILKHTTYNRYKSMTGRIYPVIGNLKLKDITPQHLNDLYQDLLKSPLAKTPSAYAKKKLKTVYKERKLSYDRLSAMIPGVSTTIIAEAIRGNAVGEDKARAIAKALDMDVRRLFNIEETDKTLSPKTVLEHHRFISSVLAQAEKEMLITYNAAKRATPPKLNRTKVNYFEPDMIKKILEAFDEEAFDRRVLGYTLVYTGARRGEVLGLEWHNIDLDKGTVSIEKNVLYTPAKGVYVDSLKTETSERIISIPGILVELLKEYKTEFYEKAKAIAGNGWPDNDFVFVNVYGQPIHPDAVSTWLVRMEKKYNLPHLNTHAFRHSVASALIYAGVDPVSVSRRLGHAQVSTTTNVYAHVFKKADERNAEILEELF